MHYQFDWSVLVTHRQLIWEGLLTTLRVASLNLVIALLVGSVVGTARHFGPPAVRWLFAAYVEFFRNVPPIVQLFFWYFAVGLDSFWGAVIGLSIYSGAYIGEVVRSGYRSTPRTQIEAARSSGLTFVQMIRYVVFPQSIMRMIPAMAVEFVNIVKNSSLAMTLGVAELTFQTQEIDALTFRGFEAATAVTVIYVIIVFVFVQAMHLVERVMKLDLRSP
jgi:polar amino acid transport system permease protein